MSHQLIQDSQLLVGRGHRGRPHPTGKQMALSQLKRSLLADGHKGRALQWTFENEHLQYLAEPCCDSLTRIECATGIILRVIRAEILESVQWKTLIFDTENRALKNVRAFRILYK